MADDSFLPVIFSNPHCTKSNLQCSKYCCLTVRFLLKTGEKIFISTPLTGNETFVVKFKGMGDSKYDSTKICDFLNSSVIFLSEIFSKVKNFIIYLQILLVIPKQLLETERDSFGTDSIWTPGNSTFHLSPSLLTDLSKLKCKDYC